MSGPKCLTDALLLRGELSIIILLTDAVNLVNNMYMGEDGDVFYSRMGFR